MKNNEILLSIRFQEDSEELSFLFDKDITLDALLEALYYGLREHDSVHFAMLKDYLAANAHLIILFRAKSELEFVHVEPSRQAKLYELGIITGSCILIPTESKVELTPLFPQYNMPAICDKDKMEYNISTRRITRAESSVMEILPPGEMPRKQKRSYADVVVPTVVSLATLCASRGLLALFRDDATGFSMLAMMMTTSIATMVTQSYNYVKQGKASEQSVEEWKENYERYLTKIWEKIVEWQESDINYLRIKYPAIQELFSNAENMDKSLFSRSVNDGDFMTISLGSSRQVEPLFEIKNEKREGVFSELEYVIHENKDAEDRFVEIIIPEKTKSTSKRQKKKERPMLSDLSYNLASDNFRYLKPREGGQLPPLLLDLKLCGALGIVDRSKLYARNMVEHIVFELSYYHAPEDLQFVFFFDKEESTKEQTKIIQNYKNLPHVNELFEDAAQFVFDDESAGVAFAKLQSIMGERVLQAAVDKEEGTRDEEQTHIVCIMFNGYNIKETGFSKYLPKAPIEGQPYVNNNGLTFIVVSEDQAQLPRYCGNIIEVGEHGANLSSRYNSLSRGMLNKLGGTNSSGGINLKDSLEGRTRNIEDLIEHKEFANPKVFYHAGEKSGDDIRAEYETAFRQISAVYYRRVAENGNVPSVVRFFDLYPYITTEEVSKRKGICTHIIDAWHNSDVTSNLSAPIGMNEHGIVELDLYEKADGPHMLVAGTTGSGKSETIITYLLGLCMKYSPTYLNLMLVDMKGGGFSDRLKALPHCVGVVDDMSGESAGVSAVYMLKRFLEVLNAEIRRRKRLLKNFGVNTVDEYIRAERVISRILAGDKAVNADKELNEKQKAVLAKLIAAGKDACVETLSHLVLVVDEFTELKRFSNESGDVDYISEITSIARIGRTLGFHIILASQNIEGAITEDIRVNCKSRICLKVATRAASKEMLDGRADAAAPTMPLNGRAYHLVGTGSKYVYFQSAYTGTSKDQSMEAVVTATQVYPCGRHNVNFYVSTKHNDRIRKASEGIEKDTQLSYIVELISKDIDNTAEKTYRSPKKIFMKPLEARYNDPTSWRE